MVHASADHPPPRRSGRSQSTASHHQGQPAPPPVGNGAGPAPRSPPPEQHPVPPIALAPPVAVVMGDRCQPCETRGRLSKCDKVWPVCSKCTREGTAAGCFQGAGQLPPPRAGPPLTPRAPPRPLPSPLHSPATPDRGPPLPAHPPSTVRGRGDRSSVPSRQASPGRGPIRLPIGVRQRSPAPLEARIRAPAFLDEGEERRRIAAMIEDMEARIAQARAHMENLAAPLPDPPVVALPVLNVGRLQPASQPRGPPAIGVVAEANFSFVLQNVVDLLRKSNGTTYVSMCYFTEGYSRQASAHGALTTYRTRVDPTTGQNIVEAAPLPDLGEARLSYAEYSGAFQRFIAVLEALGNPLVNRWRLHAAHIHLRPEIALDWPLVLSYCITIRRRSVHDHALDPGTFQSKIFEDCRVKYQELKLLALVRSASAPSASHQDRSVPCAAPAPVHGVVPVVRPVRDVGICFACGGGHPSKGCSNVPVLVTKDAVGSWLLNGRTHAPSVVRATTPPRHVVADPCPIVTPFIADAWERILSDTGLSSEFADIPPGLRSGFSIGVSPAPLSHTVIHPNHKSAVDHPGAVTKHIAKEVSAGRYSGPFSPAVLRSLIGHFRASPLGVVDKASSPGNFRIVQDFSYPRANPDVSSVNSEIDTGLFPCLWGLFPDVVEIVVNLPPGAQAATFDVDAAYRRIPVRTEDQVHTVVHWEGDCWVDHCVPFGAASSNSLFGRCGDGLLRICEARGLGPVVKWVDDFLFFRVPRPGLSPLIYAYSEADVYALAETLGVPWKLIKSVPFTYLFRYIGFDWDIPNRRVSVPPEKCKKFLHKLHSWLAARRVSLKSTESLVGSLSHCAWAIPEGRSQVVGLSRFLSSFSRGYHSRFALHEPSKWAMLEATWWEDRLSSGVCGSTLRPTPPPCPLRCFMDASSSFGVGILLDNHYAMWRLKDGWHSAGRDIGWAEIVAIELTVDAVIARGVRDALLTLHSDNQGLIGAIKAGQSHNMQQNCVLQRIMAKALSADLHLQVNYIATDENPADAPSRGRPAPSSRRLSDPPSPDEFVIDWLIPV